MNIHRGIFIVIEGPNYSGKTTEIQSLASAFAVAGRQVVTVCEPGGTELGAKVRPILKDPSVPITPFAAALLFNALRRQLNAEVIAPALQAGAVVLSDRYYMSTEIYQCQLSGKITPAESKILSDIHASCIQPDLTVFLLPDDEVIAARRANGRSEVDRFEALRGECSAYRSYAREFSQRHATLSINGRDSKNSSTETTMRAIRSMAA